ncbi:MAG: hypothetical protein HUU37_06030 [Bdellovibrionales bacterium]|nr:hypothetical protein [Bdellovibrionales bacterium]
MASLVMFLFLGFSVRGFALPYNWSESLEGLVTRCFSSREIKAHCEDFSESAEGGERMEELQILAVDVMGKKFLYSYGRSVGREVCQEHLRKVRELNRGSKQACITGGVEILDDARDEMISKWWAFETSKGKVFR